MKHLKLFFACLLMAVLSIGQVWATDPVASQAPANGKSYVVAAYVSSKYYALPNTTSNGSTLTGVEVTLDSDGKVSAEDAEGKTWTLTEGSTSGQFLFSYTSGTNTYYLYKNGTGKTNYNFKVSTGSQNYWTFTANGTGYTVAAYDRGTNNVNIQCDNGTFKCYSTASAIILLPIASDDPEPACTSEITITKADDPANGTFALDNSGTVCIDEGNATVNVTATPNAHYHLASVTSTVGSVGTISNNTCAITNIGANTTISAAFAEDDKVKVTWNVNGDETLKTDVYVGDKPVFPATPDACDATSTTFIGWATAPWTGKLADLTGKTVYTSASSMPAVNAAVTYYAVFAKSSGSASELFSWAGGGKEALLAIEGIVSSSLDADYAASHSPYQVKWNGEGKYLIIPVSAQPGKVSAGFKMIGGATTSTVDVQESTATDGEFTTVETLTISGSSNDIVNVETSNTFKSTTRAIKLLYHKGSNVGLGPISIEGAVSMSDYMTTCCTQYNVNIAAGIENGSVSADVAKACEGATVTLTFTPAGGYHLDSWSLNGTAQDIAVNTFSMPAAAATVSATFAHDDCANLAAPTLDEITKSYNSATIAWNEVADAEAYAVSVVNHATSESVFAGNVNALSKALADLEPETQYDYSIMAVGDGSVKCADGNGVLEGNFTTDALPTAHLTLIDPSGTHASSGDYAILTPFNLPTTAAACSKEFRGWDSDENCATAPTYAKGAEFTFANTTGVTLYAVYADEITPGTTSYVKTALADIASGSEVVVTELYSETIYAIGNDGGTSTGPAAVELAESATDVLNVGDNTNIFWVLTKDGANFSLTVKGGTDKLYCTNTNNGVRVGTNENNVFSISNDYIFNNATSRYVGYNHGSGGLFRCYTTINTNINDETLAFYKKTVGEGTYGNYSTACVAAPTAEPASASIEVAAAGGNGTLNVTYENVNLAGVAVALYNNEACTEAFDGGWLEAEIAGDDKHIAYNAQANTSYKDARTAYIKLTAPETSGAANPAVVVIPVEQAKKPAVFASLAELVAAELASGTEVTVSFSNVMITEVYETNAGYRYGLYLNVKDKDGENDIELFYNKQGDSEQVPDTWVKNGYVSATNLVTTWTEYKGQWELAMQGATWSWENGDITYGAPKAVTSVVVSGEPTKKAYVDGEKFNPAGLTVTVNYTIGDPEAIAVTDADWEFTPERLAKGETGISVKATYNTVQSEAFNVTGLTVGEIQLKTVQEFITAGNADMRCYLEGTVSDIETGNNKLKYGNFNLTDASGTIYVYGCLNQDGVAQKFDELGVANGDKIKVIAEDYDYYNSKHEAKNVQFVSKTSPVDITITSGSTVEKGKTLTLTATTDPAAAIDHISYSVKVDGNEGNVSLSDNVLTGVEVGEATIIASIPDGEGYIANSVEFTVEVTQAIVHASITYVENGANEDIDDVADATALPDPLPTVTKDNFLFGGWYTDAEFNTPAVAGAALSEDVTLYAKWNAIPYWATVYTSNVDFVGGGNSHENNSKVVINTVEYKAQKVGASSNTGTVTVIVPAYTHTLHFHVFTWKDRANVLSISSDDVTNLSTSTIDVNGDAAGAASTPYTINSNPVDHYQYITFDPIATEAEITFSWSSGTDKRFVMYGINQEGGVLPELDHIVITGNASTTEYEAGDEFDPAGLGVNAIYTLADVEQTPVAVDAADIEWSFDPAVLTGETSSVTVTATYKGKQANKNVNVTVTVPTTPEIIATPASINFGIVNQNATVDAQGISVTLKAVASATVTLAGDGAAAFSIDKAALSELNSTIIVTPVTTATGTFAATVTISDDASEAESKVVNLSLTVTEPEIIDDLTGTWVLATAVPAIGDKFIVAGTYNNVTKTMGVQNTNNRAAVLSTLAEGVLTPGEGTKVFTLVDAGEGKYAIKASNNKYLTASGTGTKNYLTEAANYDAANSKWTISVDGEGAASVVASSSNRNQMQYNKSGDGLFSCYDGGQTAIQLFVLQSAPTPVYTEVRSGLVAGRHYTVCLEKEVTAVKGATFWSLTYKNSENTAAYLVQEEAPFAAGKPYIIQATDDNEGKLEVVYEGDAAGAPVENGALRGTFGDMTASDLNAINVEPNVVYMLFENALRPIGTNNHLDAHRAYVLYNLLTVPSGPNFAPGKKVKSMPLQKDVTTGFENLNASEKPVKLMIDGNIYILRGEKLYDATGRLVK